MRLGKACRRERVGAYLQPTGHARFMVLRLEGAPEPEADSLAGATGMHSTSKA